MTIETQETVEWKTCKSCKQRFDQKKSFSQYYCKVCLPLAKSGKGGMR